MVRLMRFAIRLGFVGFGLVLNLLLSIWSLFAGRYEPAQAHAAVAGVCAYVSSDKKDKPA